jgi:hypothetical protein
MHDYVTEAPAASNHTETTSEDELAALRAENAALRSTLEEKDALLARLRALVTLGPESARTQNRAPLQDTDKGDTNIAAGGDEEAQEVVLHGGCEEIQSPSQS